MRSYEQDILSQPMSLARSIDALRNKNANGMLRDLCAKPFKRVLFTGMGSSNYCSWSAGQILSQKNMINIRHSTGELLYYEKGLIDADTLLIIISQSGESGEIVSFIDDLPMGAPVVAVTNDENSTLAKRADYVFLMDVEQEDAVTTRTYIASLMIVNLIANALVGNSTEDYFQTIYQVVQKMDSALKDHHALTKDMKRFLGTPPYLCLLGRGPSLSTVESGTLFLREVVKYPAFGLDSAEFRHGPMEMVDESFSGILIAPRGNTFELHSRLAHDIADKNGKLLFITTEKNTSVNHKNIFTMTLPDVDEWLSPFLTILPIQLYANALAKAKGIVPGTFRWGSKITKEE